MKLAGRVVVLTILFGACVAVAWLAVGGSVAFRGPLRVAAELGPLLYGVQAFLTAVLAFALFRTAWRDSNALEVGVLVALAWVGEAVVLTFFGWLLADELDPPVAFYYWPIATGGPTQPLAGLIGGWLGRAAAVREWPSGMARVERRRRAR